MRLARFVGLGLVLAAGTALVLGGCKQNTARTVSEAPVVAPQPEPTRVTAYINVTSGCQQETVDLLRKFAEEHPNSIKLELVDFGSPNGMDRWRADGYDCMAITFDGSSTVTFGPPEDRRAAKFHFPPGFQWEVDDLKAALESLAEGTLEAGVAPGAKVREAVVAKLKVGTQEVTEKGKQVVQVTLDGKPVLSFATSLAGDAPSKRAEEAAAAFKRAMDTGLGPADIQVRERDSETYLGTENEVIAVANPEEAAAADTTPKELAQQWQTAVKMALAAAVRKGGGPGAGKPSAPTAQEKKAPKGAGSHSE